MQGVQRPQLRRFQLAGRLDDLRVDRQQRDGGERGACAPGRESAVPVSGAGQAEVFAATASGGLAWAWSSGGSPWAWGTPIAAPGGGTTVTGSPAVSTWQGDLAVVYAALSNGQVGYVRRRGAPGQPSFGGWSVAGGTVPAGAVAGSPAGWLNSTGAAGVAIEDGNRRLAISYSTATGWSAWAELAAGF